jgi:radical SAM protein with 4Fe4S-binding SPASM domain
MNQTTKVTDGRLPSSVDFDHLIYVRVFEGCNLHCQHCFIPSNPKRMSLEDIENIPLQIKDRIAPGSTVLIQWHGGEPTLMGADFIRQGISILRNNAPEYNWRFGIQTNLMSFDEDWEKLYKEEFGGEVGISWDPKIRLLNKHALDSHPEFNKKFDAKLSKLVEVGLTPYLVVTATRTLFKAFPNPFDFFQHWLDRGVHHVHLERVTQTGYARRNWDFIGLSNAEYSDQMSRWMRAYHTLKASRVGEKEFFLSPFENIAESATSLGLGEPQSHGCWSGKCDTRFHTIDAEGYKFGCTALTSEIGNKNTNVQANFGSDLEQKRELRTYNCHECAFRPICSSGCLALSFDDGSGECSGGYRLFQTATRLAGYEVGSEKNEVATNKPTVPRLK